MNLQFHISEVFMKCPYCDRDCDDVDFLVANDTDVKVEILCEHCSRNFYARSHLSYDTYSDCLLNGKAHDFHASEYQPTVLHCKNCYATDVRLEE